MSEPRVAIIGSREYGDLDQVRSFVAGLQRKHPGSVVISGGARGVDAVAAAAARSVGLQVVVLPAQWRQGGVFDRSAGCRRNAAIVAACDVLVAFWDGQSRGTAHAVSAARRAGKQVFVYEKGNE